MCSPRLSFLRLPGCLQVNHHLPEGPRNIFEGRLPAAYVVTQNRTRLGPIGNRFGESQLRLAALKFTSPEKHPLVIFYNVQ